MDLNYRFEKNLTFEEVVLAYFDCRKNKRSTHHAIAFEFDLENNLKKLYEDLFGGAYKIGKGIAFVVEQPKTREIWAATFRDRIVHHVIYNRLNQIFYPRFIRNSFACISERGTLDGSNRLMSGMRSITLNWSRPAYYLGADIRNFFVSIDKPTLNSLIVHRLRPPHDESWFICLIQQVLFHDPKTNCFFKSSPQAFARVPKNKSLLNSPPGVGLPIGNLTSQFFANVYLNELDQFVKHELRCKYYYRYVDDLIMLDQNPKVLNNYYNRCSEFAQKKLKVEFHPYKKRLGLVDQGVDFVGFVHKPYRRYLRTRTMNKARSVLENWVLSPNKFNPSTFEQFKHSADSYYGLMKWAATYHFRQSLGDYIIQSYLEKSCLRQKSTLPLPSAALPQE